MIYTATSRFAPASINIWTKASSPAAQAYIRGVIPCMMSNRVGSGNSFNSNMTYIFYFYVTLSVYWLNISLSTYDKKHIYDHRQCTWSSILLTPSGPSKSMAWPMRSVRPQLSIRKPKSRWNLSVAALESRRLKELKQHSGLVERKWK